MKKLQLLVLQAAILIPQSTSTLNAAHMKKPTVITKRLIENYAKAKDVKSKIKTLAIGLYFYTVTPDSLYEKKYKAEMNLFLEKTINHKNFVSYEFTDNSGRVKKNIFKRNENIFDFLSTFAQSPIPIRKLCEAIAIAIYNKKDSNTIISNESTVSLTFQLKQN